MSVIEEGDFAVRIGYLSVRIGDLSAPLFCKATKVWDTPNMD